MRLVSRYLAPWGVTMKPEGLGQALERALWKPPSVTQECDFSTFLAWQTVKSVGKGRLCWEVSDWMRKSQGQGGSTVCTVFPKPLIQGESQEKTLWSESYFCSTPPCSGTRFSQISTTNLAQFLLWHAGFDARPISMSIYEAVLISA